MPVEHGFRPRPIGLPNLAPDGAGGSGEVRKEAPTDRDYERFSRGEIVALGQRFPLFPNQGLYKANLYRSRGVDYAMRGIILDTQGVGAKIPFLIETSPVLDMSKLTTLTPYNDDGYKLSTEDFDAEKRGIKLAIYKPEARIDFNRNPLLITVGSFDWIVEKGADTDFLKCLRFQLFLPQGENGKVLYSRFVSRPDRYISFELFTPNDVKALPISKPALKGYERITDIFKGLKIALPSDENLFPTWEGQFLLLPPGTPEDF